MGTDIADSVARWAAGNPRIRRVWALDGRAGGDMNLAVELEPVGDSEETLALWIARGAAWRSQLQSRVSPRVDLEWFDPDGATHATAAALEEARELVYERGA